MTGRPVTDGIELQVVTDAEDLRSLEAEWSELLGDSSATVFQSFEWVYTWWRYFGGRDALYCLCIRRGGRLLGIAPLYRERVRAFGLVAIDRLRFIGRELADYGDLIIRRGSEADVIGTVVAHLASGTARWHVCDLEDLNETSELLARLPGLLEPDVVRLSSYLGSYCPQRALPPTWDEFVQSIGPNLRTNLKRKQRKLEELFETELEVFREDTPGLEEAVSSFAAIHGRRWRSLGFPSAFDDAHHRGFHLEVARRFASRGWLRLSFIRVDGLRVASSFDFHFRKRIYMYQCNAAGPAEVMKFSPGVLIKAAAIRAGIAEGMAVYDFLRGDEAYKVSEWKGVKSKNYVVRLVHRRGRETLRLRVFFAWELMQKGARRLRREYYGLRQFKVTEEPSLREQVRYLWSRLEGLMSLGRGYIGRNVTARSTKTGNRIDDGVDEDDRRGP